MQEEFGTTDSVQAQAFRAAFSSSSEMAWLPGWAQGQLRGRRSEVLRDPEQAGTSVMQVLKSGPEAEPQHQSPDWESSQVVPQQGAQVRGPLVPRHSGDRMDESPS